MATDIAAEYEQLVATQESALQAWRDELDAAKAEGREPDIYIKFQHRSATDALDKFRSFWRGIDASIYMDDPDYGLARGAIRGRRGGELVQVDSPVDEDGE